MIRYLSSFLLLVLVMVSHSHSVATHSGWTQIDLRGTPRLTITNPYGNIFVTQNVSTNKIRLRSVSSKNTTFNLSQTKNSKIELEITTDRKTQDRINEEIKNIASKGYSHSPIKGWQNWWVEHPKYDNRTEYVDLRLFDTDYGNSWCDLYIQIPADIELDAFVLRSLIGRIEISQLKLQETGFVEATAFKGLVQVDTLNLPEGTLHLSNTDGPLQLFSSHMERVFLYSHSGDIFTKNSHGEFWTDGSQYQSFYQLHPGDHVMATGSLTKKPAKETHTTYYANDGTLKDKTTYSITEEHFVSASSEPIIHEYESIVSPATIAAEYSPEREAQVHYLAKDSATGQQCIRFIQEQVKMMRP